MPELMEQSSDAVNDAKVFTLLFAFYNTNPDRRMMESLSYIDTAGIQDLTIKAELEAITSYAANAVLDKSDDMITALKVDWTKLFRGLSPDYGAKPPYEELYGGGLGTINRLAEFYTTNGYHSYTEIDNRPDYIGTQLDFLKVLALRKAHAASYGDTAEYERLESVSVKFAERVKYWFVKFSAEAEKYVETSFYAGVLKLGSLLL